MAQLVEHILGKDEVTGPTPVSSSKTPIPCVANGIGVFLLKYVFKITPRAYARGVTAFLPFGKF